MEYLILHKPVKIQNGDDIGKDGLAVRLVKSDEGKILVVVQFAHNQFGVYNISDVEIIVCC
jgi:hypothetical protein